jgi:hypothetical protein
LFCAIDCIEIAAIRTIRRNNLLFLIDDRTMCGDMGVRCMRDTPSRIR